MDPADHSKTVAAELGVAIIGAGFAGIGMGASLLQAGLSDFLIFERRADVGGVWRDNSYPGCGCDVESHLYSFSFAPNPNWSRTFSRQSEIWQYLKDCTTKFKLEPHLRFQYDFISAHWEAEIFRWRVVTSRGCFLAKALVSGMGAFSEPSLPKISGLARFQGKVFHSANWNHDYDLKGRNVAVIGTGASAIQFIPAIQPLVRRLTVFQRTPAWIVKRLDRSIAESEKERFRRHPWLQKWERLKIYLQRELLGLTFRHPRLLKTARSMALHHLHKVVKDPVLREKLTPNYTIGCKRVLLSNDFYPAMIQSNVDLVVSGVREVRETSIISGDGVESPIDAIIFGTGFQVTEFPLGQKIFGATGQSLETEWAGTPKAFLGIALHGFPNFFMLLGPNTGLGHTSVVLMIEAQISHAVGALQLILSRSTAAIDPKLKKQRKFVRLVDRQSAKTVWLSGCRSWYIDRTGRNSSVWPFGVGAFVARVKQFSQRDYRIRGSRR